MKKYHYYGEFLGVNRGIVSSTEGVLTADEDRIEEDFNDIRQWIIDRSDKRAANNKNLKFALKSFTIIS